MQDVDNFLPQHFDYTYIREKSKGAVVTVVKSLIEKVRGKF